MNFISNAEIMSERLDSISLAMAEIKATDEAVAMAQIARICRANMVSCYPVEHPYSTKWQAFADMHDWALSELSDFRSCAAKSQDIDPDKLPGPDDLVDILTAPPAAPRAEAVSRFVARARANSKQEAA